MGEMYGRQQLRPLTDPEVTAFADVITSLPVEARDAFIRAVYQAVCTWESTRQQDILVELARDVLETARLHRMPGYQDALSTAPDTPTGPGRSLEEIFPAFAR